MEPLNPHKLGRTATLEEKAAQQASRVAAGLPATFGGPGFSFTTVLSAVLDQTAGGPSASESGGSVATGGGGSSLADILGNLQGQIAVDPRDQVVVMDDPDRSPPGWAQAVSWQLGVRANDPVAHLIGMNIAKRRGLGLNWYPADRFKQSLVGRLEDYGFYNPRGSGDEADWNLFIRPNARHAFLRDDVLLAADLDKVHRANDGTILIEAELTPDDSFYDNPYFHENGTSPLIGRDVGVYGPWVLEEAHGWRPEIHPCQLVWWKEENRGRATYHLMTLQDDSNRFDVPDHFSGNIDRPWAKPPVSGEFGIAVRIPQGRTKRYRIEELENRNVVPSGSLNQPRIVQQAVGPETNLEIELSMNNIRNVAIGFEPFLTAERAREERGFFTIRTQVGKDSRGGEGYQVLRVTELPMES